MKKGGFTLLVIVCLLFSACGKKEGANPSNNTTGDTDKPTGGTGSATGNTCNTKVGDVENLQIFPADNSWNTDISKAPADPYSDQIIAAISASHLKADFGSGLYEGVPIGIPFDVVCGSQPKVKVTFRANDNDGNYGSESDKGPYPIPDNAHIEGNGTGDSHVIVVDKDNDMLYELYNASFSGGKWGASSGAIFDLKSNKLRPAGWTSADAAGLPIFPGLVRYDEVLKGTIDHAIRFTLQSAFVKPAYISPARHSVNSHGGQYSLPFGAKIRLKASFDISGYPPHLQVILTAMKKYGLILADIGSNMYISGAPDSRWNNDELQKLGGVRASDFEVVKFN
ncbi:MAG TPA: hypothetical protein VIM55_20275 [Mucilaginibacter sp.]